MKNSETRSEADEECDGGKRMFVQTLGLWTAGTALFGGCLNARGRGSVSGRDIGTDIMDDDRAPNGYADIDSGVSPDAGPNPDTDPDAGAQPDDNPYYDIDGIQTILNVKIGGILSQTIPSEACKVPVFTIVAEAIGGDINVSEFVVLIGGVRNISNVKIIDYEVENGHIHVAPTDGTDYFTIPEGSGEHSFTVFADYDHNVVGQGYFALVSAKDVIIYGPDDVVVDGKFPLQSGISISSSVQAGKVVVVEQEPEQNIVEVGTKNVELFKAQLSGDDNEDMAMESITIENAGTASFENFGSLRLELGDGIVVEPVYVDANKISFSFDLPIYVAKQENIEIKLLGDADNVIHNKFLDITLTDVYAKGSLYNSYSCLDIISENTKITFVEPQN